MKAVGWRGRRRAGWLVALGLLTVAAIGSLSGCDKGPPPADQMFEEARETREREGAQTTYGQALERAEESTCEQYVGQLQATVQLYQMDHGAYPPDLATVIAESKLPPSELQDCNFQYDPATGRVSYQRR